MTYVDVLLVDDDRDVLIVVGKLLEREGLTVEKASNGEECLEKIKQLDVGVVILDWMMPGMSGNEVLKEIRRKHDHASLPVLMHTARNDANDVVEVLRAGANDFLNKPVRHHELRSRVLRHLALSRSKNVTLGGYTLVEQIGVGGMGIVYRAEAKSGDVVAVKVIKRRHSVDPEFMQRFDVEVESLARITHPNVVRLIERGTDGETVFLVTELVDGESLVGQVLASDALTRVGSEVSAGLAAIHAAGVIHRDIKPGNLVHAPHGPVKIIDFGIARTDERDEQITQVGFSVGSPSYAAPEQLEGNPVPASDVYALGITLFELLAGRLPWAKRIRPHELHALKLRAPLSPREAGITTTDGIELVISQMTHPIPSKRPTAAQAAERLGKQAA